MLVEDDNCLAKAVSVNIFRGFSDRAKSKITAGEVRIIVGIETEGTDVEVLVTFGVGKDELAA